MKPIENLDINLQIEKSEELVEFFQSIELPEKTYFKKCIEYFNKLKSTAQSEEQLIEFLTEDIIYNSIYSSFFEQLVYILRENQDIVLPVLEEFNKDLESREKTINNITLHHFNYINHKGKCEGCLACSDHNEVEQLIAPYFKKDLNFLIQYYLGGLLVNFIYQQMIYKKIPINPEFTNELGADDLWTFRLYLFDYIKTNLKSV